MQKSVISPYEVITQQIIKKMEEGYIPWEKTWTEFNHRAQSIEGRPYRGFNALWLEFIAWYKKYKDPRWVTYNAAAERGGHVIKDETSQAVPFYNISYKHEEGCHLHGKRKSYQQDCNKSGLKGDCKYRISMKYYSLFNVEQVEGLKLEPLKGDEIRDFNPIESAEVIANEYLNKEGIEIRSASYPAYHPVSDYIQMPNPGHFQSDESYYCTLFHEMGHSTASRLDRKDSKASIRFGDPSYAKEELVAEMTSAFLSRETKINNKLEDNQRVAYLQSWLKALHNDPKLILSASSQAQKACDYILGTA